MASSKNNSIIQYHNTQRKLGVLHSLLLRDVRRWMDEQAAQNSKPIFLYDIRRKVENIVLRTMKDRNGRPYNHIYNCLAFPVGVNKNNMAAHHSPFELDNETFDFTKDSVSIDFGLFEPTLGVITDGAFTWNAASNDEGQQLSKIAEMAVDTIIKQAGPDAILGELGADCQEYIESTEVVLEGGEECLPVRVLKDLCGHKIDPYVIHAGKAVPSIGLPHYTKRMMERETYAIEVFPTTGSGESFEVPIDNTIPNHLSLNTNVLQQIKTADRRYVAKMIPILTTRKCVPFHPEWYNLSDDMIRNGSRDGCWKAYPPIKTKDNSLVVQWEKMIRITDNGNKLLLQI